MVKNKVLRKADEFSSVFNFRKRISGQYIAFHYQPNLLTNARLGMVVSKKTAKSAVHRNYMRRVLRECFRLNFNQIAHVDLIVRVQKRFDQRVHACIAAEFDQLLNVVNTRLQKTLKITQNSSI